MVADRYLLDTNILSHLIRTPHGPVARRIRQAGEGNVFTSIIVASELRFGARKKGSAALTQRVDQMLASLDVQPLDIGVDRLYADIRFDLESVGQPIGANDLWIAAHALAMQAVLVTNNRAEFQRVPGLRLENWLDA
jgi:tRNA(fMet)-specific endonuclease VapC